MTDERDPAQRDETIWWDPAGAPGSAESTTPDEHDEHDEPAVPRPGEPGSEHRPAEDPDSAEQPEAPQPEAQQPEVPQPEVQQPEAQQPEVQQPEAQQPEAQQPVLPDWARPAATDASGGTDQQDAADSPGPWGPPDPSVPSDPWGRPGDEASSSGWFDHTQPVDLDHTQVIPPAASQSHPDAVPGAGPYPMAAAYPDPHGGPYGRSYPQGAYSGAGAYSVAGDAAYPPEQSWNPAFAPTADAGYPGQPTHWGGTSPHPGSSDRRTRGPGWGALVGIAAVSAILAGLLGGVAGGWLGSTDRLDFARGGSTSIPQAGAGSTSRPEGSVANIAAKALPSIVTIKVEGADGTGTGSGFVLDQDGRIITNNHVVAGAAEGGTIQVVLSNGEVVKATIKGRDTSYDLAVLETQRRNLAPLVLGRSEDVVVGDQVIAVGAPLGLDSTVTVGIVSALNRPVSPGGGNDQSYINAIQTDAAINPGNSGGPLLNMSGQVIGVNSAIARVPGAGDSQSGNIGVGFSIPADQVRKTAEQLIATGKAQHPIIGVVLDREFTGEGAKISDAASAGREPVTKGGPAEKAGLRAGDVIIEFEGKRVANGDDLVVAIRARSVGDTVSLKIKRGNREVDVKMTLEGTTDSN